MFIPEDALPHGITECRIQIETALSCDYVIPAKNKAKLVSGVYHINSTHSFAKPVTIYIQHFSSNTDYLFFGINSDPNRHPLTFEATDHGNFSDKLQGIISVESFSIFAIFTTITSYLWYNYRYLSSLHYGHVTSVRNEWQWDIYFVIIRDLELYQTVKYRQ